YCATSDLSQAGLQKALDRATEWAQATRGKSVVKFDPARMPAPRGQYESPFAKERPKAGDIRDLLMEECKRAKVSDKIVERYAAPNCPSGTMDVLLMPDQMMLQIHESIGHPLELDRILGDERNYAGTSFVTPEMFGSYRYGSELLNVTYDPMRGEMATFAFDD